MPDIRNGRGWLCVQYVRWFKDDQLYEMFTYQDPENPLTRETECFRLEPHLLDVPVDRGVDQQELPLGGKEGK